MPRGVPRNPDTFTVSFPSPRGGNTLENYAWYYQNYINSSYLYNLSNGQVDLNWFATVPPTPPRPSRLEVLEHMVNVYSLAIEIWLDPIAWFQGASGANRRGIFCDWSDPACVSWDIYGVIHIARKRYIEQPGGDVVRLTRDTPMWEEFREQIRRVIPNCPQHLSEYNDRISMSRNRMIEVLIKARDGVLEEMRLFQAPDSQASTTQTP